MSRLDATLAQMAPGVTACRDIEGTYNPRWGLAIYSLPVPGYSPSSPGVVLGEALAARSGLGCTLLEGVPEKIPAGAAVVAHYNALKAIRPELLDDIPEMHEQGQYAIKLDRHALITSMSREGLAAGMQTLAMLVLRHNGDLLPGCVITDSPFCQVRCLAIELDPAEISITLLMQIVSFAATFKANRLHLIPGDGFDPSLEIPGVETFTQTCNSFGIALGVRLPLLGKVLSGEMTADGAWSALREAAHSFGASQAAFDDPCPANADPDICRQLVRSAVKGETGLQNFSLDARAIAFSGVTPAELKGTGVTGWHRLWETDEPPPPEIDGMPLGLDVQAPPPGFSARTAGGFHHRLDAALRLLRARQRRELTVSFRDIGVSHMWQNMLYPAASGLIAGWGEPSDAESAAWRYSNLLYGDSAEDIMNMWDAVTAAFPHGLDAAGERLVRRVAFGEWPEDEGDFAVLAGIKWSEVTRRIKSAAETMKSAAADLSRNAITLSGARLSLYALSWLHCFVVLMPELEKRRRTGFDEDGRTEPIAAELYNNFLAWFEHLRDVGVESGLEFAEMEQVESMGLRLKELCDGVFE